MTDYAAYLLDRLGFDAAPEAVEALEPEAAAFGKAIANRIMAGDVWQRSADGPPLPLDQRNEKENT
jgi:hypothetical protein